MDFDFVSVYKHAKKELGQYPAILTSHLVNNSYVFHARIFRVLTRSGFCRVWLTHFDILKKGKVRNVYLTRIKLYLNFYT